MKNKFLLLGFVVLLIFEVPQVVYRYRHPEKTETQLFLDFFKVYKEF